MNLKINAFSSSNYYNNTSFKSNRIKAFRYAGYTLIASTLLAAASCKNNNAVKVVSNTNETDSSVLNTSEYYYKDNSVKKIYHYLPKDNVNSEKYDWLEMIYPDGRIEKDSMGHKILISSQGKKTVIKTENDKFGNKITTTYFPDSTMLVKIEYKTNNPNEVLYVEKSYWKNGNLKQNRFHNEFITDKDGKLKKTIEESIQKYNEKEVLIYWKSNVTDPERNEANNKYDRKNRLIYDDIKNEKYEYKGLSEKPFRAVSVYDDCERITLFNKDGSIKKVFFKALDGTITEK